MERYLERPRHIEIQVLGDASGNILSFPERDCSLQRRHQKLVEESPSPVLDEGVREQIMDAAARVSKQVGYGNAGTCEFLLDSDQKSFYFLEMNTRLQVEHPVTELVCGVDLVRAQILTAAGEPLEFTQEDLTLKGAAIECRINAENPAKMFAPSPGRIGTYREPSGPGVRVDSGAEANYTIPQAYDPMIAKLVAFGANREEARRRMLRALDEYTIEGIKTTIPFHRLMLADERFAAGQYHTGTVEREMDLAALDAVPVSEPQVGEPELAERSFTVEIDGKRFSVTTRERLETKVRAAQTEASEERDRRGRRRDRHARGPHAGHHRQGARRGGARGQGGRGRRRARGDEDGELDSRPRQRHRRRSEGHPRSVGRDRSHHRDHPLTTW